MTQDIDLELSSGRLHALRWGRRGSSPVICIPGLSSNARAFDAIAAALTREGHEAAVLEDVVYGSQHDARTFWPSLDMPTLLVRAARPLTPGGGSVVGVALRDEFIRAVPSAKTLDVDANHYGVMAHPEALRAITGFLTC